MALHKPSINFIETSLPSHVHAIVADLVYEGRAAAVLPNAFETSVRRHGASSEFSRRDTSNGLSEVLRVKRGPYSFFLDDQAHVGVKLEFLDLSDSLAKVLPYLLQFLVKAELLLGQINDALLDERLNSRAPVLSEAALEDELDRAFELRLLLGLDRHRR